MDISLNQNGSGTVALEYQISKSLDSLGKLDGNERWNTIPVGRADFERTMDRLPDMRLLSFSSKDDGKNLVISARMEFSNLSGLFAFLDAGGRRSSFSGDANSGRIALTLAQGTETQNQSLDALIASISEGYEVRMSMSFPGEGNLFVSDGMGMPVKPDIGFQRRGKKVSCGFPLYEILSSRDGIIVEFQWN